MLPQNRVLFCLSICVCLLVVESTTLPPKSTKGTTPCSKDLKGVPMTMPGYTPTSTVHTTTVVTTTLSPAQILLRAVEQDTKHLNDIGGGGASAEASSGTTMPPSPAKAIHLAAEPVAVLNMPSGNNGSPDKAGRNKEKSNLLKEIKLFPVNHKTTESAKIVTVAKSTSTVEKKQVTAAIPKTKVKPPMAQGSLQPSSSSEGNGKRNLVLGSAIGGSVAGVALIAGIVLTVFLVKRKRSPKQNDSVDFAGTESYADDEDDA